METTRHVTATVYVVHPNDDGDAVALHEHDKHGLWLAPGGHVERDELPTRPGSARSGKASASTWNSSPTGTTSRVRPPGRSPARPRATGRHQRHRRGVGHQHVDLIYYAEAPHRDIDPEPGEQPAGHWDWVTKTELADREEIPPDVSEIGRRAIRTVAES